MARQVLAIRFSGYNFRKSIAQHISDNNMLDKDIQKPEANG